MKSRIWRLAGVGLLSLSVSTAVLADEPNVLRGSANGGQHGGEGRPGNNGQERAGNNQNHGPQNQPRPEHNGQNQGGQWQGRPSREPGFEQRPQVQQPRPQQPQYQQPLYQAPQVRPPVQPTQPSNNLPIQSRPDTVHQTQSPLRGSYQDVPRRGDNNAYWQPGMNRPSYDYRPGGNRPSDNHWPGRPDGHGNGWGPGPQYRPGYVVDRFPDRNLRVPYRGRDYFFSGGYWYRPQGPRYVVVTPPYGIRVGYLPDYAREVWIGSSLFFLAAGAYYLYQADSQDYVVVQPPVAVPAQPVSNGYDVVAYPINGQTQAQVEQDRYDCYRWAVEQSRFDPATVTYAPDASVVQTYRQAQGSCLNSRGYQVTY